MSFRPTTVEDFKGLESSDLIRSSYRHIAYPLGCSKSELAEALGDGDFVLADAANNTIGFARVKAMFAGICYLDLHLLKPDCEEVVNDLLMSLGNEYGVGKYYVQILENEHIERQCLEHLEFTLEATLKEHVFIEGHYQNIIMMGSVDYRV